MRRRDEKALPDVLSAAIGLAAAYFRIFDLGGGRLVIKVDHVAYVLNGHLEAWIRWPSLEGDESLRFARLVRARNNRLANAKVVAKVLDDLFDAGELPGCLRAEDYSESGH